MTPRDFLRLLHRAAAVTEEAVDEVRRDLWRATGRHQPRHISAYQGWADGSRVHVSGRVLANRPAGGPLDDHDWWDNLVNTWRRWESDEVPGVSVRLRFKDQEQTVVTDEEGYYQAEFTVPAPSHDGLLWLTCGAAIEGGEGAAEGTIEAEHDIMVPPTTAAFGIISDLDDTVIHTGITSLLLAAKLTFLENAKTRKPLEGVASLYQALQLGQAKRPVNPLFYISSSPWNLHDLLADFLRLNEIPPGPLLLRDVGLDRTKFIKEPGHGHKEAKALGLLDAYPDLPFVLIGDSGQDDPGIYASVAEQRPGRVVAIYIRDIDPETDSEQDTAVHRAVERAAAVAVPMVLARDSLMIAEHASRIGLIPPAPMTAVIEEIQADRQRPGAGEEAMQQALHSMLGEDGKD
ncbi:App1 family protein [Luteolibacter soli]|uniref:Phosphatase domain-containing protein n=1 Tax=Luteolibacter soli TaxID=3135280 RepID=A0ABU9B422_9BACT